MRAVLRFALFLVVVAWSSIGPAKAEPGPVGNWLMDRPMTLWDKGMMKIQELTERARKEIDEDHGTTLGFDKAEYHWDTNEIDIVYYSGDYKAPPSHRNCNIMRTAFLRHLTGLSSFGFKDLEEIQTIVPDLVNEWFSHVGFRSKARDKKLGEKLAQIIFVRVGLSNGSKGVTCRARILEWENAPSRPTGPRLRDVLR